MTKLPKIIYTILFVNILAVGLISPLNKMAPEEIYPFFNWSLFDYAPPYIEDYMVRVTCEKNPEIKMDDFVFSLEDNSCLQFSSEKPLRERNRNFQKLVKEILAQSTNQLETKYKLESFLELKSYNQIVLYKRTYNPKELYFSKKFKTYEKLLEINR